MPWFRSGDEFPFEKLVQFLASLLSLFSMMYLGFADDVLDIRWRVKIWMPLVASLPLLMVYYATFGLERTYIVVPVFLRWLNGGEKLLYLGFVYYLYMVALCVFCTNAINILAGINGIEGGQALVIAVSICSYNIQQITEASYSSTREAHLYSLYFMLPFVGVCIGYLQHNWYPAKVFGGDTFAYFAGMLFSVVAIQSHFTVTVLLFMAPQGWCQSNAKSSISFIRALSSFNS